MSLLLLFVLFGCLFDPSYAFGFARPAWVVPKTRGSYGGNMVWRIGDVETVTFDCPWPEYKIELWQQSLLAAGAAMARQPVYQQTLGQVLPQQFNWTVTKNQFNLDDSPVFFFWLKEVSDASNPAAQTSAFFNITEDSVEASPPPSLSSSTTLLPSSTASVSTSPTASSVPIAKPTAADEQAPSATQDKPSSQRTSDQPSSQQTSVGLSTGATAGIAAGVGVVAIAVTSCVILLILKRRKKAKQQRWPDQQQPPAPYYPPQYGPTNATYLYESPKQHPQSVVVLSPQEFPNHAIPTSELPGDSRPLVVS